MKWIVLIIVVFLAAYMAGGFFNSKTVYVETVKPAKILVQPLQGPNTASIKVPAVDDNGMGVITIIEVQVIPGAGNTLANIDDILFWVDTQNSIRTARHVAENITGIDLSGYNLIYTITANASVIEGPSAGAAITIATIAALENKTLKQDIMITGTILSDGTIGPVGAVLEKARVARDTGATTFLVPRDYVLKRTGYERVRTCETRDGMEYCKVDYKPKTANIGEDLGIEVRGVGSIEEAIGFFI